MKYTFERMDELRDIAVAEWQAIPRANTRDIIVDVRVYDRANNEYEAYRKGWEAQEEAKLTGSPVLGVSAGPVIVDEPEPAMQGPLGI